MPVPASSYLLPRIVYAAFFLLPTYHSKPPEHDPGAQWPHPGSQRGVQGQVKDGASVWRHSDGDSGSLYRES